MKNKFKQGDTAVIVRATPRDEWPNGTVVTVMENSSVPFVAIDGKEKQECYTEDQLEHYNPKVSGTFGEIGDLVHSTMTNRDGVILDNTGDTHILVRYNDGKENVTPIKNLKILSATGRLPSKPEFQDLPKVKEEEEFPLKPTAIMPPVNNKLKPEKTMQNFKVEKRTFVNGTDVAVMSEDALIGAIVEAQAEEKRLIALSITSKLIDGKIAEANAFVIQASKLLDSTFGKK